ncbi:unnamed protein product [Caenorhabditis sp. 36 PRJEB53466]|nr:unnamed protein product [Caenorhabditis sp. 36 PRJEB53466]
MPNNQMEVGEEAEMNEAVKTVFHVSPLRLKIIEKCMDIYRESMFVVDNRSRVGNLKKFLELRLVSSLFDSAVHTIMRKDFKVIRVDIDNYYIRCNNFTIGQHTKGGQVPRFRPNRNPDDIADDDVPENELGADELQPEDMLDVIFIQNFLTWLDLKFEPPTESFTIYDSWSFKPCMLPPTWCRKLSSFRNMHPDMEYCRCNQCVLVIRSCRRYFGPLSFRMAQDALQHQEASYGTISCTDSFLADIALEYTRELDGYGVFNYELFEDDFKRIQCDELRLALQTIPQGEEDQVPWPHPLEAIQLLVKLWRIKTLHIEVVTAIGNEYYVSRRRWERYLALHAVYFATFNQNQFDISVHVGPFRAAGTIDKDCDYEILPIFDLRNDDIEPDITKMGSHLSLLSLASQADSNRPLEWKHQGRIAFNMFRATHFLFLASGIVEFRGSLATANFLKHTVRHMMRITWGARDEACVEKGKTVYWINFLEDACESVTKIWNDHLHELFCSNFPGYTIRMNTADEFQKCRFRRIATFEDERYPDIRRQTVKIQYVSFYKESTNNTTHMKFVFY